MKLFNIFRTTLVVAAVGIVASSAFAGFNYNSSDLAAFNAVRAIPVDPSTGLPRASMVQYAENFNAFANATDVGSQSVSRILNFSMKLLAVRQKHLNV